MKFPRDVRVDESPAVDIRWLQSRRGSEFSKKRSATLGRFAISVSEIKCAVLRQSECCFHARRLRSGPKAGWQIDRTQSIYTRNVCSLIVSKRLRCEVRAGLALHWHY